MNSKESFYSRWPILYITYVNKNYPYQYSFIPLKSIFTRLITCTLFLSTFYDLIRNPFVLLYYINKILVLYIILLNHSNNYSNYNRKRNEKKKKEREKNSVKEIILFYYLIYYMYYKSICFIILYK